VRVIQSIRLLSTGSGYQRRPAGTVGGSFLHTEMSIKHRP
jgi:hypothetical protein